MTLLRRGFVVWLLVACLLGAVGYIRWQFPGEQLGIAWTLGTGRGVEALQARTDSIERTLLRGKPITREDQRFLVNLYSAMATGGRHLPPLHQSGVLLRHFLQRSGEPLQLHERVFLASPPVKLKMGEMRARARRQSRFLRGAVAGGDGYVWSERIHMSDAADPDSYYALYWGRIGYRTRIEGAGKLLHLHWRAEVPWRWPRYAELKRKYGRYRAEVVPVPNVRSIFYGNQYSLRLSNGLGGYLEEAGLAKSFLAYAEWDEVIPLAAIR